MPTVDERAREKLMNDSVLRQGRLAAQAYLDDTRHKTSGIGPRYIMDEHFAHALTTAINRIDEARAAALEEAARAAEADNTPAYGPHRADMEFMAELQRRNIAATIRALGNLTATSEGEG